MIDIAVVGSGIGGSLISALNRDKKLILFEKGNNLGGCASTFTFKGDLFNTGATTLMGLENNQPLKKIFDKIECKCDIKKSDIAYRVIQGKKNIDRIANFDQFIENINRVYPHKNNYIFWHTIKKIDEDFWNMKEFYFAKYSTKGILRSSNFLYKLILKFNLYLIKSGASFINEILYDISQNYLDFIESQLLITVQDNSKNIPLLSMALGLCYPFHDVYYANGGMGKVIEEIVKNNTIYKNNPILKIEKKKSHFILHSHKNSFSAKKVILNTTVYDSAKLFEDEYIKKYYNRFSFSDKSAFVLYLKLNIKKNYLHHYQIILQNRLPFSISKSIFVSFSDIDDKLLSNNGLSVTISTHTKASYWENLNKIEYEKKKSILETFIIKEFLNCFQDIKKVNISRAFSATSKTFDDFISRTNCGGVTMNAKNIFGVATCNTPIKNLYNIGDTVFAGQGWSGIAIGVNVLDRELNG